MRRKPLQGYTYESILFGGIVLTSIAISFLGAALDTGSGHFSILILLAACIYLALGI